MTAAELGLVAVALAFAWSMGAHYTGACMGMPFATKSIGLRAALWVMAPLTLIGAAFLSHRVLQNVGHNILVSDRLATAPAIAVIAAAFLPTTLFTQRRIPTSTIQILVFCIIGTGAALGLAIRWQTVVWLAVFWVLAPFIACGLGYAFTKLFDAVPGSPAAVAPG